MYGDFVAAHRFLTGALPTDRHHRLETEPAKSKRPLNYSYCGLPHIPCVPDPRMACPTTVSTDHQNVIFIKNIELKQIKKVTGIPPPARTHKPARQKKA